MTRRKNRRISGDLAVDITPQESRFKIRPNDLKTISPLTKNQRDFFYAFEEDENIALMLHGVAGSGKTFIAMYNAFFDILHRNTPQKKIIVIRSAVPSREIGHLPGNEKEKSEVYMMPYKEICQELFPRFGEKAFTKLHEQGYIDFMITSHIRGLTLDNAIIIIDEVQNCNYMELNTIMTRIGKNSRLVVCGDFRQTDLNKKNDTSGLPKFFKIVERMPGFMKIEFGIEDIVRSDIVREWILASLEVEEMS